MILQWHDNSTDCKICSTAVHCYNHRNVSDNFSNIIMIKSNKDLTGALIFLE